jgi:hypothetical protein
MTSDGFKRFEQRNFGSYPIQNTFGVRHIDPKELHETDFWNHHSGLVRLEN